MTDVTGFVYRRRLSFSTRTTTRSTRAARGTCRPRAERESVPWKTRWTRRRRWRVRRRARAAAAAASSSSAPPGFSARWSRDRCRRGFGWRARTSARTGHSRRSWRSSGGPRGRKPRGRKPPGRRKPRGLTRVPSRRWPSALHSESLGTTPDFNRRSDFSWSGGSGRTPSASSAAPRRWPPA